MSKTKTVLGRGLASLIPRQPTPPPQPTGGEDNGAGTEIVAIIPLGAIRRNPYQPRLEFDPASLDELKRSIQEKGIIQPITVRRVEGGYQLITGERRVRAAKEAGLERVPAYIIRVRSDEEMLELALIENLQREHLNPIEIAISYRRLIEECRYTQEEVSSKIGKDRTTVTNALRLLKLPEPIQTAVRKGDISSGHARALVAVEDGSLQMDIFRKVMSRGLSVREVERLARERHTRRSLRKAIARSGGGAASSLANLEERLRRILGTKVRITLLQNGRGEIVVEYYSAEDLDRLIDIIGDLRDRSS
jgi:ParB family chromosome partitioning protein